MIDWVMRGADLLMMRGMLSCLGDGIYANIGVLMVGRDINRLLLGIVVVSTLCWWVCGGHVYIFVIFGSSDHCLRS